MNKNQIIGTDSLTGSCFNHQNHSRFRLAPVVSPSPRRAERRALPPWKSFPPWLAIGLVVLVLLGVTFVPSRALAGSGRVNSDGTIDITLNFRFPPNAADLVNTRNQVTAASRVLWDSSEGQLRFGRVTFTCGSVNEDDADMWVFAQAGRAGVSYMFDGSGLRTRGYHVNQFLPSSDGLVLAHEFGHLALGLGDEYSEQSRFGACWGFGQCAEAGALSEQNQCLMQQPAGFTQSEFCTSGRHDTLMGDNLTCAARAVPHGCADNCQFFNHTTGRYETSQQTANVNRSCWAQLRSNFSWLTEPTGLPVAAAPAGFTAPTYIENCGASDTVMLFLDRSGSMQWNTERDNGEVCGDGADNDGDGMVDEAGDCTQTRLAFVKAAARAWLALANNRGVRAGIISFNETATYDRAFQPVTDATLPGLNATVDGLIAGGDTAIGSALRQSIFPFDAETVGVNKTAFLISDGISNRGEDPRGVVPDLRARGVRVFTISTGGASSDRTLSDISGTTGGASLDSPSGTTLVNFFAQQWARYRNITTPVPLLPYATHGESPKVDFQVLRDTPAITMIFAGNMSDMSGFGLRVIVTGPGGETFDTAIAHPDVRVVSDRFFMLVELRNMRPGDWTYQVLPAPGASVLQTGNLTVLDENPDLDLFTSLDRRVVEDPSVPVELSVMPIYHTELRNLAALTAVVRRPDGVVVPVVIDSDYERGAGGKYRGRITDMPMPGMYQVIVTMRTGPATFNEPGESIFETEPENSVAIPPVERTVYENFFVPHENDRNDEPEKATPIDLQGECGTVRGSLRPSGDIDYYKIEIPASGAKVWINLDTGGTMAPGATSRDSFLTLFAADGVTVVEEDDDDGSGNGADSTLESSQASVIGGRELDGGTYYIAVRAFGAFDIIDPYTLTVVLTDREGQPEVEPNDHCEAAHRIRPPVLWRRAAIDHPGDVDYYSVTAEAGQIITVIADGDPKRNGMGTDVTVSLLVDCQAQLFSANSSGAGTVVDPTAEGFNYRVDKTARYYIRVESGREGTGLYDLMVTVKNPGQFRFSDPAYSVNEDGAHAVITVQRDGGSSGPAAVQFTAFRGNATVHVDYLETTGTLTFLDGETSKQFAVPIVNDGLPEGDEYVHLMLFNATGGASLGELAMARLTIIEVGQAPKLNIRPEANGLRIAWPLWAHDYLLEATMDPGDSESWQPVQEQVVPDNDENAVFMPASSPLSFYRLRKE